MRIGAIERFDGHYYTAERLDQIFSHRPDPWSYVGDPVSEERLRLTLETLPEARDGRMLEVGCAEGWMTEWLADRTGELVAVDVSAVAIERAKERCRRFDHVTFSRMDIAEDVPDGPFDAIVCCGVLVLLPARSQARVRAKLVSALRPGGVLLLENQI